jgi:hypothetical protein
MRKFFVPACAMAVVVFWTAFGLADRHTNTHSVGITVNEIAELGVFGINGSKITIVVKKKENEGDLPEAYLTNKNSGYLRYTSIIKKNEYRRITGAITNGTVPEGVALKVTPITAEGNKKGAVGSAVTGKVTLSGEPEEIVTGIGSGWTGTGQDDGVQLEYSVTIVNPDLIKASSFNTISVDYVLTEN